MPGTYEAHLQQKADRCDQLREDLQTLFPEACTINLEIGCGHGHYLSAYAENHPSEFCLGVDLVTKRIERAMVKKTKRAIDNLYFLKAEIKEFIDCLPTWVEFNRVFILFPDPWPKNRHAKNRIIQKQLLDLIEKRSNESTHLHFRTDHDGQFQWGMELIGGHQHWVIDDEELWPFENPSFFQDLMDDYFSLTAVLRTKQPEDYEQLAEIKADNKCPAQ